MTDDEKEQQDDTCAKPNITKKEKRERKVQILSYKGRKIALDIVTLEIYEWDQNTEEWNLTDLEYDMETQAPKL